MTRQNRLVPPSTPDPSQGAWPRTGWRRTARSSCGRTGRRGSPGCGPRGRWSCISTATACGWPTATTRRATAGWPGRAEHVDRETRNKSVCLFRFRRFQMLCLFFAFFFTGFRRSVLRSIPSLHRKSWPCIFASCGNNPPVEKCRGPDHHPHLPDFQKVTKLHIRLTDVTGVGGRDLFQLQGTLPPGIPASQKLFSQSRQLPVFTSMFSLKNTKPAVFYFLPVLGASISPTTTFFHLAVWIPESLDP